MNAITTRHRLALTLAALGLSLAAITAQAAPLATTTPAHVAPDSATPILRLLPAGTEPQPAPAEAASDTPANWRAITIEGPFELYVRNGDIDKGLQIKPGSALYQKPDLSAPALATAAEGDLITITGLQGRWTQVELDKTLVAYIPLKSDVGIQPAIPTAPPATKSDARFPPEAKASPAIGTEAPAATEVSATTEATATEAPANTEASTITTERLPESVPAATLTLATYTLDETAEVATAEPESPAPAAVAEAAPTLPTEPEVAAIEDTVPTTATLAPSTPRAPLTAAEPRPLPRAQAASLSEVKGKLVSTYRRFAPRRPYDWQLTVNNQRIAYLDFSKMQGTDQLDRYARREVVVIGLLEPLADGQSYVIRVESLRLQ